MKRKFILIGECWQEIDFATAVTTAPAGTLLSAAFALKKMGEEVVFISEIALDPLGEGICGELEAAGVDISCCDRYQGRTSLLTRFPGGVTERYDAVPDGKRFDIAWPRIEKDDVVVFGGYAALDPTVSDSLWSLLRNAADHRATVVYIPDADDVRLAQMTKFMSTILDNFGSADLSICLSGDTERIFGVASPAEAYSGNIEYHCRNVAVIDSSLTVTSFGDAPHAVPGANPYHTIANILAALPPRES